jgi:ABC-type transport system substrate-binding protein
LLRTGAAVGAGAAALSLIGCGGNEGGTVDKTGLLFEPQDTTTKATKGGVFPSSSQDVANFNTINGADSQAALRGYSRFVKWGVTKYPKPIERKLDPDAMASWEVSGDGLTWTWKIRPNMKFDPRPPTNGKVLTSADIVYSWENFEKLNPQAATLANKVHPDGAVISVSAPDANTAVMKLAFPYSPLAEMLTYNRHLAVLPTEARDKYDIRNAMFGTGPWRLKEFIPSARLEYTKNPDWYEADKVMVDGLSFFIIPEYAAELAQFRSGAIGTMVVNPQDILPTKRDKPQMLMLQETEYAQIQGWFRYSYLPGSPFLDERVRKAFSMLLDRDLIIEVFRGTKDFNDAGLETPIRWNSAIGAGNDPYWIDPLDEKKFGADAKWYKHNPTEALALLKATGLTLPIQLPYISTSYYGEAYLREGEVQRGMAEEGGGFKLTAKDIDYRSDFRPNVRYGFNKHEGIAWGSSGQDYPDIDGVLQAHYVPDKDRTGELDASGKPDAKLAEMIRQQRVEVDQQKRITMIQDLQRYLASKMYRLLDAGDALTFSLANPWIGNYGVYRAPTGGSEWSESYIYWWIDNSKKS